MADVQPGAGDGSTTLDVTVHPLTTIHPNDIQHAQDNYYGGIALSLIAVPYLGALLGIKATISGVISALGVYAAVNNEPVDPYEERTFRFRVTEYKYLWDEPSSASAGYADFYVKDIDTGVSTKLKRVNIAKNAA